MQSIPFYKYHGLGNDFVVMRASDAANAADPAEWVGRLCDRHLGVGADGLLYLSELDAEAGRARMVIYNRDGSRPEMCGNGVRCVVRHLVEVEGFAPDELTVVSDAGPRICRVVARRGPRWQIKVEMGAAQIDHAPVVVSVGHFEAELTRVSMGNPHAVAFERPEVETIDRLGEALNTAHPVFEEGVNVEFVEELGPNELRVDVYERGVGRTLACGTGACAAAAAAIDAGICDGDAPVDVHLPGGTLCVEVGPQQIWMTGPVASVFRGELSPDWLDEPADETNT